MDNHEQQIEALKDIRNMMERSSRFVSLNGFAGVFAGIFALCGAWAAHAWVQNAAAEQGTNVYGPGHQASWYDVAYRADGVLRRDFMEFFMADAFIVLFLSVAVSSFLTIRKARKAGIAIWDPTAKRLFLNMMIPLASGGFFCLLIAHHGFIQLVAPCMLIFYGLALINSSKYTYEDIRYLGLMEIALGLAATLMLDYGIIFWAVGFGFLHIVYGILMYYKYER